MSEEYIVRHCAPTLAGLKTGSIFTCPYQTKEALLESLRQLNRRLGPKGLRVLPLRFSKERALVYVYRPQKLSADLSDHTAARLLQQQGYPSESCAQCVGCLARKLRTEEDFPHEIGLFLGYPAEDVHGFMEKGPDLCKASGCWKVYGDEAAARKKFAQYKKCTQVYCDCWVRNHDIDRLTVADDIPEKTRKAET